MDTPIRDPRSAGRTTRPLRAATAIAAPLLLAASAGAQCGPFLLGQYDTPGAGVRVTVSGTVAYVADNTAGVQLIDITDPTAPTLLGSWATPGLANFVAVSGTVAYVAVNNFGLQILDVTDPTAPSLLGTYDTPGLAFSVAVSGTRAYVADGPNSGLQVIDVSNPASPTPIGSYLTPGFARGVTVSGTVAYVADDTFGLHMIDISNPALPVLLGTYDTPDIAREVAVAGAVAYVADFASGLQMIDVSDPTTPTLLGTYDTPDIAESIAVSGTVAFVADSVSGLLIIDVANPAVPILLGIYNTPGLATGVAVTGGLAYVANQGEGLYIIDIASCFPCSQVVPASSFAGGPATEILCDLAAPGDVTYTFNLVNDSGVTAYYALLPPVATVPGDGSVTISPNIVPLVPPLPSDGTTTSTISVTISGGVPGETACFRLSLTDQFVTECCAVELCVALPTCDCLQWHDAAVVSEALCLPDGTVDFELSFTVDNLRPEVIEHAFLASQTPGVTFDPLYVDVASVPQYGSFTVSTAPIGVLPGQEYCVLLTIHDESLAQCCARIICFTAPPCTTAPLPCVGDCNGDTSVDFGDLILLLSDWGPCGPGACPSDFDGDAVVGFGDLLVVLASWGACP